MNNRQWIAETLAHRPTGKVPYNFMFSPPAQAALESHYGTRDLENALGLPLRGNAPASVKPLYASPAKYGPEIRDEFGVSWSTNDIDRGSPIGPALREPTLAGYRWPDPLAEYRIKHLAGWTAAQAGHYRMIWVGDLWERATFMRGMEEILLDLAMDEAFVAALLRGLADHILRTMDVLFARFEFECVALSDDYGTQHGMLMSPDTWRRLIKPFLADIYGLAHKHGRTVFHHTCGNVRAIVPDFIELGLDILHPIQPEAMDIFELKRQFGRDLTFCGGVRTQDLLPFGTPDQVRDEVQRLQDEMGDGGGYILEPGITLQADVPLANLVALIDQART